MTNLTRRSVLRSSLGLAAAGALARPHIANAQAKTANCGGRRGSSRKRMWRFKKIVADYGKASGNTIELSIIPFAPMRQKIVSAMTSGVVPDLFRQHPDRDSLRCSPGTTSWSMSATS